MDNVLGVLLGRIGTVVLPVLLALAGFWVVLQGVRFAWRLVAPLLGGGGGRGAARERKYRGPMVEAFFGLPGAGKTFAMVSGALRVRAAYPAMRVWSNFPIRFASGEVAEPLETVDDWEAAGPGLVLLDEAHILLGSREWTGSDRKRVLAKMGQLRKSGVILWYTTHDPSKVDKQLRNLTEQAHWMFSARAMGFFFAKVRNGASPGGASLGVEFVRFSGKVKDAYDSWGAVGAGGLGAGRPPLDAGEAPPPGTVGTDVASQPTPALSPGQPTGDAGADPLPNLLDAARLAERAKAYDLMKAWGTRTYGR